MKLFKRNRSHPAVEFSKEHGPMLLAGLAAGAVATYLVGGGRAKRRRALMADKTNHISRVASDRFSKRTRDLRNRARGVVAETRGRLTSRSADDDTLEARVRSQLGHHVDHTSAIETEVRDGVVTLRGPVLADALGEVLRTTRSVRGVKDVRNELDVYEDAGEIPALQ